MSSSAVILSLCIIWSLFAGSISYTEEIVHYRTYPYGYRNSYVSPTRGWLHSWDAGPSRSDRPIYTRRDTQLRPYTQLMKVEREQNDPLETISETLGALNTVGNYIVNMTRGVEITDPPKELPSALYTISKNILGRNVTDSIAPLVRGVALPLRQTIVSSTQAPSVQQKQPAEELANRDKESAPSACTTAEGGPGKCQDLSNCPQLLLDLQKLRHSFCFKSLFVPGVCCPVDKTSNPTVPITSGSPSSGLIVGHPPRPTIRPTRPPTPRPIPLYPVTSLTTRPPTDSFVNNTSGFEAIAMIDNNFIQDDDECGVIHSVTRAIGKGQYSEFTVLACSPPRKILCDVRRSTHILAARFYLQAIQKVPGDTAREKWRWLGRLSLHQASEDFQKLPSELLPIVRVEIAVKEKRHEDVTSALKCEDLTIINRALKASWFFDGSHKNIIGVSYFCEQLFPYVSVNTRTRIVLALAHRLFRKDPIFAQQMFTAVSSMYDIQTAYPLIIACDEAFAYKTIVEKELVPPIEIARKIFRKNPDLIVRFLKLLRPREVNATERSTPFATDIKRYHLYLQSFLPKLIKKRLDAFIELCEIHETHLPTITLSNTCTDIFLKKAQHCLIRKPLLYIQVLPLKKINENLLESIFPSLLPTEISSYNTNSLLIYLKHYPRDKKYDLLRKSYKNKYCADLLDKTKNVTSGLLELLPTEERIKQARIKLENQNIDENDKYTMTYEEAWICYLSVDEAIPIIKEEINKTQDESKRLGLILQMIYVCKINEDDDALCDTLTYLLNRHKNENSFVFESIFNQLLRIYDVPRLNEKQISLILDMVRLYYVKNEFVMEEIVSAIIHFKLIHNMPIEELISMLVGNNRWYVTSFNILQEYPEYERQCLTIFANVMKKMSFEDVKINKTSVFCDFVVAIYDFNGRCNKSRVVKVEKMTIRDYPWLIDVILDAINSKEFHFERLKDVVRKSEPELYRSWFPGECKIASVTSGAALASLKRDLQDILDDWEKYLGDCMMFCYLKRVQHFVRATRWYKDLPVKFAVHCINYIYDRERDKVSSSVIMLSILLHGDAITKLIDPLTPTKTTVDTDHPNARDNYKIVQNLPLSMRLSDPPVSLDLIVRLCQGDYLSIALMALTNVSRRTALPKVMSLAVKLTGMRVSTRKHGIRLMSLVAPSRELVDFLQKLWTSESHHSVRQVLYKEFQKLFLTKPNPETWSLYYQATSTLNLKDEDLLFDIQLFSKIPNEYIAKYLELWLETIDAFRGMGLNIRKTNKCIFNLLTTLTVSVANLLPEELADNILRRFLFHIDTDVSFAARRFTISYILSEDKNKHATRIKVFADVLHNAVTSYWNIPHPQKLRFYPVNNAVRLFIDDFVVSYVDKSCFKMSVNPKIIDNMQTTFLSILSPKQDAKSYLLLTYANRFQECISTQTSFGLRLGQQLHELTDVFSSRLVLFMADVLKYFLSSVYEHSDLGAIKLGVIEGLVEAGNRDSCFMAVSILPSTIRTKDVARYDQLVDKFREMEEPVVTILYNHLNETDMTIIE